MRIRMSDMFAIEHAKHRHRYCSLVLLPVLAIDLLYLLPIHGQDSSGTWEWAFLELPLLSSIFLPITIAVYCSRVIDIEHTGRMWNMLYTYETREQVYRTKVIYITLHLVTLCLLQTGTLCLVGTMAHYGRTLLIGDVLFCLAAQMLTTLMLAMLQCALSYLLSNQAAAICTGLAGSLLGVFCMYLPSSWLRWTLPWGLYAGGCFYQMDYDAVTSHVTLTHLSYPVQALIMSAVWMLVFVTASRVLLRRQDTEQEVREDKAEREYVDVRGRMQPVRFHRIPIEWIKLRHTPAWAVVLVLPAIADVLGVCNYLANTEILTDGWYSLWTQVTLFLSFLFLPAAIGTLAAMVWRPEHLGTTWNQTLTLRRRSTLVLEKYAACLLLCQGSILWMAVLYMISGHVIGLQGAMPAELPDWIVCGCIGAMGVCGVQVLLSLWLHSYVLPIIIAVGGGFAGLMLLATGDPYLLPYSLMGLGLRSNNTAYVVDHLQLILTTMIYVVLPLGIAILYLRRSDVRTA